MINLLYFCLIQELVKMHLVTFLGSLATSRIWRMNHLG